MDLGVDIKRIICKGILTNILKWNTDVQWHKVSKIDAKEKLWGTSIVSRFRSTFKGINDRHARRLEPLLLPEN